MIHKCHHNYGRSVALSEAGETILPIAREVLRSARVLDNGLREVNNHIGGEFLIGCSTSAGKCLLPVLLARFRTDFPLARPSVRVIGPEGVHERLLDQTIPIGVTSNEIEHRDLECLPLFDDRIILIVPARHPWAAFGHAVPDDLLDQPIIMREQIAGTYETALTDLKARGITPDMLNVAMDLGNPEAIEMAVELGVGLAFISEMVAARGLAMGSVRRVELDGFDPHRTFYTARNLNIDITRAQALFWEFAQAQREHLNADSWDSLVNFAEPD